VSYGQCRVVDAVSCRTVDSVPNDTLSVDGCGVGRCGVVDAVLCCTADAVSMRLRSTTTRDKQSCSSYIVRNRCWHPI
jgi:hypothetical protein